MVAAVSAAAGILAGLIWGLVAPGEHVFVAEDAVYRIGDDSNNVFVATALYVLFSALAGLACAAGAWAVRRLRGPAVALALVVGGLIGAWAGIVVGEQITELRGTWPGLGELDAVLGQVLVIPATVDAWPAVIGQPLAATVVYAAAVLLHPDADLGRGVAISSADAAPRTRR